MELAVVGSEQFVMGFRLTGIRKAFGVREEDLASKVEDLLDDEKVGILVLSSDEVSQLPAGLRRRLEDSPQPVVIFVGRTEEEDLRAKVRRAIGVDLYGGS
jgi:V/A-type H+-transporting ATPase subunit F